VTISVKQTRATLQRSWGVRRQPMSFGQGGPYVHYTTSGGAAHPRIRRCLYATDLSAFCDPVAGRDSDYRTTNDQQPAANRSGAGPRSSLELSPRLVPATLVELEIGPCAGGVHPASLGSRGAGVGLRRRHRRRAPGKEGLRQGLSSRRGPFDPFLHRLPLGTQGATSRKRGGVTSLERTSCARFGDSRAWLRGHFEQFQ